VEDPHASRSDVQPLRRQVQLVLPNRAAEALQQQGALHYILFIYGDQLSYLAETSITHVRWNIKLITVTPSYSSLYLGPTVLTY
jgi:hypothetical protein